MINYAAIINDSDDEENVPPMLAASRIYNISLYLSMQPNQANSDNVHNNGNINNDTKPVTFKKKNVPQMGRKKANRALNGISYIVLYIFFIYMFVYLQ